MIIKRILFYLGHPAHYHAISRVAELLAANGHGISFIAREKDVLSKLLQDVKFPVHHLKPRRRKGKLGILLSVLQREWRMYWLIRRIRPDLLVGTDIVITHVGKALRIPSVVLNEDDATQVPLLAKYGFKYSTATLSPTSCDISPYCHKKVEYSGYHELAYLHPKYFTPNRKKVIQLSSENEPYFILRFSSFTAHHDEKKTGISDELACELVQLLKKHGRVHISSERELTEELEPYRIMIDPRDMHHALYFARLYIGDSQTMAAEAAVLGTPSIRFNDFVGKLGYLEELEHKFGLTYGISTSEPRKLISKTAQFLHTQNLKRLWQEKTEQMLNETVDVAAFWMWFFEHFPDSLEATWDNPNVRNSDHSRCEL